MLGTPETEHTETCSHTKATLVGFEGPGASGKGETIEITKAYLSELTESFHLKRPIVKTVVEPPREWDIDRFNPYNSIVEGAITDITALYATALWRQMRYRGAKFDGKSLDPGLDYLLSNPNGILFMDRLFPSTLVYQEIYPDGVLAGHEELFQALHRGIPIPDLLFFIIPDLKEQQARLEFRQNVDIYDRSELQPQIHKGYEYVLDRIRNVPGIYRLESTIPINIPLASTKDLTPLYTTSFLIALRIFLAHIEKSGQIPYMDERLEHAEPPQWIFRVHTPPGISAYIIWNVEGLFKFLFTQQKKKEETTEMRYGFLQGFLNYINGDLMISAGPHTGHYTLKICFMAVESWSLLAKYWPWILRTDLYGTQKGMLEINRRILAPLTEVRGRSIDFGFYGTMFIPSDPYKDCCTELKASEDCLGTAFYPPRTVNTIDELIERHF